MVEGMVVGVGMVAAGIWVEVAFRMVAVSRIAAIMAAR